jgi:hypothetical protein
MSRALKISQIKEDVVKQGKQFRITSIVLLLSLLTTGVVSAATLDCTNTKVSKEELSRQAINPGDRPDREMVQLVRVDIISSDNAEFNGIQETVFIHLDHIGATGSHSGYGELVLNSGEKLWVKSQGTHNLVVEGDNWKLPFHGVFRFIAGTGKYKAIRGGGSYDGVVTESGLTQTASCSAEY